jgi:cyclic pyranopterin phosphate synthase
MTSKLIDKYHRHLNYLRVSITDRCNLECVYCRPGGLIPILPHAEILSYEEILRIVGVGVKLGISKVRITGGEPLVRRGVFDFLKKLAAMEGIRDLSLTTNGVLLRDNTHRIRAAGIRRINVSLDTLDPRRYHRITGRDCFDRVWQGIEEAHRAGLFPIKINVVALRGVNEDELTDLAALSLEYPFHVRFIEYMPMGMAADREKGKTMLTPEIRQRIETLGSLSPVKRGASDGPAERFRLEGARGEIGFISAISQHFCHQCNRLRLTASGQLRSCLLSDRQVDMKTPLRTGCSDDDIAAIFFDAVRHKPSAHHLASQHKIKGQMSAIGG